jgi:hypothetical protein
LFDLSYVPAPEEGEAVISALLLQMRRIGIDRFLFGSDYNVLTPAEAVSFIERLGLTEKQQEVLIKNCAPGVCPDAVQASRKTLGRVIRECKRRTANRGNGDDQAMNKSEDEKNSHGNDNHLATGIAIGIAIGAGIGAALHNLSLGIAVGIAIGAGIGVAMSRKDK